MNPMLLAVGLVVVVALGGGLYWRHRRQRASRLVAFVALLREPMNLDPFVLAKTAGRAWGADLGDGSSAGPDGFVMSVGPTSTIFHDQRMYLVNSMPFPYMKDPEAAAGTMVDLRVREAVREHQAWFSCDALGVDRRTSKEEIAEWYRRLARLFVELLDDNSLVLFLPDIGHFYPINDDTDQALLSDDPIQALQDTRSLPVIPLEGDDPKLLEAIARARENWPQFVDAFHARSGQNHSVKAPISYEGITEFIWISVDSLD